MRKNIIQLSIVFGILLSMVACAAQPTSTVVTAAPTPAAVTPETDRPLPTDGEVSQPTPEIVLPTLTLVEQNTALPESTAKPQLGATANLNCRKFPLNTARILGHAEKGQEYDVLGMDISETWYLIPNPQKTTESVCWIWAADTTLLTEDAEIPIISATTE